jgi:lysozyme
MNNFLQWVAIIAIAITIGILMKLGDKGTELLKHFEGCELSAYQDSVGVWTIGYGHTKGVYDGMTITQGQAEQMLLTELEEYEGYIESMVTVPLTQNQFDALVVWVYNLGPTNFRNSTLLKELNAGNYNAAGQEITRWNKAGGKVLAGLVKRREAEAELFNDT